MRYIPMLIFGVLAATLIGMFAGVVIGVCILLFPIYLIGRLLFSAIRH